MGEDDSESEEVIFCGDLPIKISKIEGAREFKISIKRDIVYFGESFKIKKGDSILISGEARGTIKALGKYINRDVVSKNLNRDFGKSIITIYLDQEEKLGNKFNHELFLNLEKQIEKNNSNGIETVIILDTNFEIYETVKNYSRLKATKIFVLPILGLMVNEYERDTIDLIKKSCNKWIILNDRSWKRVNPETSEHLEKKVEVQYEKGDQHHYEKGDGAWKYGLIESRIMDIRKNKINKENVSYLEEILGIYTRLSQISNTDRAILFFSEAIVSTILDIEKIMKPVIDPEIVNLHNNIISLRKKTKYGNNDTLEEELIKSEIDKINDLTKKQIKNQIDRLIGIRKFDNEIRINQHLMPIHRKLKKLLSQIKEAVTDIEDSLHRTNETFREQMVEIQASTKSLMMEVGDMIEISDAKSKEKGRTFSNNTQIKTSLALIINDQNQNSKYSNTKNREVALLFSNKFRNGKENVSQGINAKIISEDRIPRRDLVGAIFSQTDPGLNLRQLQRSGEIGHVEISMSSNTVGTISISSSLSSEMNLKIAKSIEQIKKIGPIGIQIQIDRKIGAKKKIIIVDDTEKYLRYLWDMKNEINSLVLFNQKLEENRKKNILRGADVLIVDCEEKLEDDELLQILNECRPNGTAKDGHFLFIEVDNGNSSNIRTHAFNNWIKKLRNDSGVDENALSAGLKKIILYSHNSDGSKVNQETKKASWLEEIHYEGEEIRDTYADIENYLSTRDGENKYQFKCLNDEILLSLAISFEDKNDVFKKKIFQMLEKFDKEIYDNEWGEAKYTIDSIKEELQDVYLKTWLEIINMLEDLTILSCYLNNGEFEITKKHSLEDSFSTMLMRSIRKNRRGKNKRDIREGLASFFDLCEIEYGEKRQLDDIQRKKTRDKILAEMKIFDRKDVKFKTIYSRKISPLLKLKHEEVDLLLNEKFHWDPKLEWKIKHLIDVSKKVSIDQQVSLMQDLWMILQNEEKTEESWKMIDICPREWVYSILINLYNSELINKPVEINENYSLVIEKWIKKYPWEIIDLISTIKLFNNPKINPLLSKELQKIDIKTNKEILKNIWKRDRDTEESLVNWFKSIGDLLK